MGFTWEGVCGLEVALRSTARDMASAKLASELNIFLNFTGAVNLFPVAISIPLVTKLKLIPRRDGFRRDGDFSFAELRSGFLQGAQHGGPVLDVAGVNSFHHAVG